MNTKGIKFLAVLAVLAMAFAAVAVVVPAEEQDAAVPTAAGLYTKSGETYTEITGDYTASKSMTIYAVGDATNNKVTFENNITVSQDVELTITSIDAAKKVEVTFPATNYVDVSAASTSVIIVDQVTLKFAAGGEKGTNGIVGATAAEAAKGWVYIKSGGQVIVGDDTSNSSKITSNLRVYAGGEYFLGTEAKYGRAYEGGTAQFAVYGKAGIFTPASASGYTASDYVDVKKVLNQSNSVVRQYNVHMNVVIDDKNFITANLLGANDTLTIATGYTATIKELTNPGQAGLAAGTKIVNNGSMIVSEYAGEDPANLPLKTLGTIENNGVMILRGEAANVENNKTIKLYGDITTELENNGVVSIMSTDVNIESRSGTGTIDTTEVSEEASLSGNVKTTGTTFTEWQIVTMVGDTTVKATGDLTFEGTLIIPAGTVLTIEDGGKVIATGIYSKIVNYGEIVVEGTVATNGALYLNGGEVINYGTISAAAEGPGTALLTNPTIVIVNKTIITNDGEFIIGENNKVSNNTNTFINGEDGTVDIMGDMGATILNSGVVTIYSENNNTSITVRNEAAGAEVRIMTTAKDVTVNDYYFVKKNDDKFVNGKNCVEVKVAAGSTVSGLIITSGTYKVTEGTGSSAVTKTHTTLILSGIVDIETDATSGDHNVDLTLTGESITVADTLTLSHTDLIIGIGQQNAVGTDKGVLYVSGLLTVDDTSTITNTAEKGTVTVPGCIMTMVDITSGKINAATYTIPADPTAGTKKVYVFTNIPDAVIGAAEAEVAKVIAKGTLEIEKNVDIPVGMTFTVAEGATITIAKDIQVEVFASEEGLAYLSNGATIEVKGKLIIDNFKKSAKTVGIINSEVIVESGTARIYTTLAWAISDVGTEEATITLGGDTVISSNTTIPENITVDTNGKNFTVKDGAVLTVNGELYLNGGAYTVEAQKGVVVNGIISKDSSMAFDGAGYPAGLYFSTKDYSEYYIAGIAYAEVAAIAADEGLAYWGDLKTTDIEFDVEGVLVFNGKVTAKSLDVGSKAKVTFKGETAIDTITMGISTIVIEDGAIVTADFNSVVGSMELVAAKADGAVTIAIASKDDVTTMSVSNGAFKNGGTNYKTPVLDGAVVVKTGFDKLKVDGDVSVEKSVTIADLTINGTVYVANEVTLTSTTIYVNGELVAAEKTDEKAKGVVETTMMYAGLELKGAAAGVVVSGDVNPKTAYVAASATVPEDFEDLKNTVIYIGNKVFMTAYGATGYLADIVEIYNVIDFGVSDSNAKFTQWNDSDGNKITAAHIYIGDYTAIFAVINYDVYKVSIITDNGIKSVALNGVEMKTIGGNTFETALDIPAGTYKVTYTLKSGYEGQAILSTSTGTILKDNSFAISPGGETKLFYQLNGTQQIEPEPTPEPEKESEWTITTILLVVLVILIAIMAVIVALRLNRN